MVQDGKHIFCSHANLDFLCHSFGEEDDLNTEAQTQESMQSNLFIPGTVKLRLSANRHSQFNHITLKKCYTNQRHLWQRNIIPQLQLITHTSSPCIPFTYLNKSEGICQGGKHRLVKHARKHAVCVCCVCVAELLRVALTLSCAW